MKWTEARAVFQAFRGFLLRRRVRFFLALIGIQGTPILEFAFVSAIYGIIEPSKVNRLLAHLSLPQYDGQPIRNVLLACSFGILIFYMVLRYLHDLNLVLLKEDLYTEQSRTLIHRYLRVKLPTARKIGRERVATSVINDGDAMSALLIYFATACAGVITLVLYAIGATAASWEVLLSAGALAILPLYINRKFTPLYSRLGKRKVKIQERALGFFTDLVQGFARSKLDSLEVEMERRSLDVLKEGSEYRIAKRQAQSTVVTLTTGVSFLGVLCTVYLGIVVFDVSVATIMILFVMFARMRASVSQIGENYLLFVEYLPNANRLLGLVRELEEEIAGAPASLGEVAQSPAMPPLQQLELQQVSFSYHFDVPVLKDLSMIAQDGDRIWIKGDSGQGKSTLFHLFTGLLEPTQGKILINGKALAPTDLGQLREQVALVSPAVYLFKGTVRDNLLLGVPEKDHARLDLALTRSGLQEVISQLPLGLDTVLQRDGENLSLGQRQRVILARIYMRDASLILLDEATANLDRELEERVLAQVLEHLAGKKILILVAHKRPPLVSFTQEFEMAQGRLVRRELTE